ncbi:MAG: hypothetical protein WAZ27_04440 [Minisyncoccia bacterium]
MMVVTAIFMILSGVVLSTNARFGDTIILKNLGHDMALAVREAQVYGISVRRFSGATFDVGYGMHFATSPAGTQSMYQLYGDANANGVYDEGGAETVTSTTIRGGYRVVDICARAANGIDECGLSSIDILFRRPEPDALIRRSAEAVLDNRARIIIESNRGDRTEVVVEASGQISVQ